MAQLAADDQPAISTELEVTSATSPVVGLIFETSASKRLAVVRQDGSCFWDADGTIWRKSVVGYGPLLSAAWKPFGLQRSIVAFGFEKLVVLRDAEPNSSSSSERESSSSNSVERIREVAVPFAAEILTWSPEGRTLFVANRSENKILTIDAALGKVDGYFAPFAGVRNTVKSVAWSSAKYLFVSGNSSSTMRVFSGDTLDVASEWVAKASVLFGEWSRDGTRFICGSEQDGICVMDLSSKKQWVVVDIDSLKQAAESCGCRGDSFKLGQIAWSPATQDLAAILFADARSTGFALFSLVRMGNMMGSKFLRVVDDLPKNQQRHVKPVRVQFSPYNPGTCYVVLADNSVQIVNL